MSDAQLLGWATEEIRTLRRRNELLEAQLHIVNIFGAALFGPPRNESMTQDFLQELIKRGQELSEQEFGRRAQA